MSDARQEHWNSIFTTKAEDAVSWFQATPETSLRLIRACNQPKDASILDVGAGASHLPDVLLAEGFRNLAVLDVSDAALAKTRARLGDKGQAVRFIVADLAAWQPDLTVDVWHDRAVLHFLTEERDRLRAEHVDRLLAAIRDFAEHSSIDRFFGSVDAYRRGRAKSWITHGGQLAVILYHRGQSERQPAKTMPPWAVRPPVQPEMRALVDRWLDISRPVLRPNTLYHREISLRRLLEYLATAAPEVRSFAQVTRDHVLGFLAAMAEDIQPTTGRRLATHTRRGRTSDVALFFRDLVVLGWEGPGQLLIDSRDKPRAVGRVPRFIPQAELDQIMEAIRALPCPYQRAALLTLRWSGARRGEVRRLSFDCLDRYPDGTHRLRLPAGNTYKERTVPLHDEAAEALRGVMVLRADTPDRWFTDELTGGRVRHLFVARGKLISAYYLFETALQQACRNAGLVDASGHGTISAHRFRHTLGTQLAERGAKLDTIMSVLGHQRTRSRESWF